MRLPEDAQERMEAALDAVRREFATVRTGKATPAILDSVRVPAYGGQMPLNQVATVSAPDPSLLIVQPFDPSLLEAVEKAVLASGLGLNPSNDGSLVRVPIPSLTEDRRKEYARLLHKLAEEGRVSVRHARHAANDEIKARLRDHEIGEDEAMRLRNQVQKLTDEYGKKIDLLLATKEREVLAI